MRTNPRCLGQIGAGLLIAVLSIVSPAIAADTTERLHVAWIGLLGGFDRLFYSRFEPDGETTAFRNYAWDLFSTISRDGGDSFSTHYRVDDAQPPLERLLNDPSVSIGEDGTVRAAWTDQAGRMPTLPLPF